MGNTSTVLKQKKIVYVLRELTVDNEKQLYWYLEDD